MLTRISGAIKRYLLLPVLAQIAFGPQLYATVSSDAVAVEETMIALNPLYSHGEGAVELFMLPPVWPDADAMQKSELFRIRAEITVEGIEIDSHDKVVIDGMDIPLAPAGQYISEHQRLLIRTMSKRSGWQLAIDSFAASEGELIDLVGSLSYRNTSTAQALRHSRKISLWLELSYGSGAPGESREIRFSGSSIVSVQARNLAPAIRGIERSLQASALGVMNTVPLFPNLEVDDTDSLNWHHGFIQLLVASKTNTRTTEPGGWVFDGRTVISGNDGYPASSEALQVSGVTIGKVLNDGWTTDVAHPEQLYIALNNKATPDLVQRALRAIHYVTPVFDWKPGYPVFDTNSPFFALMQLSDGDSSGSAIIEFSIGNIPER